VYLLLQSPGAYNSIHTVASTGIWVRSVFGSSNGALPFFDVWQACHTITEDDSGRPYWKAPQKGAVPGFQ
jgi:hypothetical protein